MGAADWLRYSGHTRFVQVLCPMNRGGVGARSILQSDDIAPVDAVTYGA
jgi:hypothetical protein